MTSLDLWEAFAHAYRERSISAAARRLDLSQPAVTARIRKLEHEIGATLFERSRTGLVPTGRADALAARITPLVDQLRGAVGAAPPIGPANIRIGGAADVMSTRVVPALAPLVRDGLDLSVATGLARDLLDDLAAERLDMVVSSVRPGDERLRSTALVDEEFLLVATPALAAQVDPADLAQDPVQALAGVPLAAYSPELPIIRRYWLTEFDERPANRTALVMPDLRGILRAVVAGIGASVLPRYLVDGALADGTVVRLHQPRLGPLNTLWLVTGTDPSPAVAHVCRHLSAEAAGWAST
ncbi:LysR family transcriptional regulator [Nocardioides sp. KC13]|uniref:LysR family transcriptional regulator n=1 Tax=Nocardioides turkmenicus TaxID=2711220 RepID=A0A6M1QXN8_9ACTN|nr:LysR family transcriptional regulator [Nocardioides sp. KC13]NGN91181.1 LysR family transcriptional regulator [Nocardioides sp. KC13]